MRPPQIEVKTAGVYLPWSVASTTDTAAAAALMAVPDGLICGPTCLALHGVALPRRWQSERQHVWVSRDGGRPRRPQIIAHRSRLQLPPVVVRGIPCVAPIEAWLQLGVSATVDDLVAVGDGLIRRKSPLTTLAAISQAVASSPRRPGIRLLREAVPLLRARTDSIQETRVRLRIVHAGLPCPTVNVSIFDQYGELLFSIDMGYEDIRLGVEYDGAVHVSDRLKMERDVTRRRILEDLGWRIVTVTRADLAEGKGSFLDSIRLALGNRVA